MNGRLMCALRPPCRPFDAGSFDDRPFPIRGFPVVRRESNVPEVFGGSNELDSSLRPSAVGLANISYAAFDFLSALHVDDGDGLPALESYVEAQ